MRAMIFLVTMVGAAALGSCVQVVQQTDCRGSPPPCGTISVDTHNMTSVPVTVPVSAVP
jgi:hypothetical protein